MVATTAMFPGAPESIEIIGTLGTAALQGGNLKVSFLDGRSIEITAQGGSGSGANIMDFPHDAHLALITDFLDAIEQARSPRVSGEEALATHRLIEAVLTRAKGGATPMR